jgi:hypothetical protein
MRACDRLWRAMKPALRACAMAVVAGAAAVASADDARVRTSATVEVIDDQGEIDEVIARLRAQTVREPKSHLVPLKQERPPTPPLATEVHRTIGPEAKPQLPGARRPVRERDATSDRTERARPKPR